ncbi:hypothetical protein C7999DRAFT_16491 [Corynascus novoguineensis]|uniref:Uncharacterized protein n=1 Tax=Corynascus novoguineensis TaxID=1126955 RepID=A0AAN7HMN3_9PEZI|nr:hypothetical protein C7999DRAFT_16491 [Corynascus novoguineensis]
MPIRNPFARRPGPSAVQDENQRPGSAAGNITADAAHPGFERVDTVGSKASSAFSIRSGRRSQDTGEYKMSVVNDSGVYLPPSPVEREASWPHRYLSRTSSSRSSSHTPLGGGEIEHFPISRESFDSYRRSFDISARSPVVHPTNTVITTRQSLDSSLLRKPFSSPPPTLARFPRSSLSVDQQHARRWWEPPTPEESEAGGGEGDSEGKGEGDEEGRAEKFEDVGLNEQHDPSFTRRSHRHLDDDDDYKDGKRDGMEQGQPQARKRAFFFGKFGVGGAGDSDGNPGNSDEGGHANGAAAAVESGGTVISRLLPAFGGGGGGGRKRAQSGGQGAELGMMPAAGRLDKSATDGLNGGLMQPKGVEA